jgi:class 3 adenylate cyclase
MARGVATKAVTDRAAARMHSPREYDAGTLMAMDIYGYGWLERERTREDTSSFFVVFFGASDKELMDAGGGRSNTESFGVAS